MDLVRPGIAVDPREAGGFALGQSGESSGDAAVIGLAASADAICLVAIAIALNVGWVVLNWRRGILVVFGLVFFLIIIAANAFS